MNVTPKQLRLLREIRDSRLRQGYAPTMQELADQVGVSKVTIFEHVEALIRKGLLTREPNKARSLEVAPGVEFSDQSRVTKLPLLGSIALGSPIEAIEERKHLDLEELFNPPGCDARNTFTLRVRGDTMFDDHVCDGDYVICEVANQARNGQTVVALLDTGEATLKRIYKEKEFIRLAPANTHYSSIWVKPHQVQVQGIVIGVIRTY